MYFNLREINRYFFIIFIICICILTLPAAAKKIGVLLENFPFVNEVLSKAHREITLHFKKYKIDLPATGVKRTIKSLTGSVVASEAISENKFPIEIIPSESDAVVNIMDIEQVYKPGIELPEGNYYISVEKDGFRTKRFWIQIDSKDQILSDLVNEGDQGSYVYNVEMKKKGLENCKNDLEISNYNSGLAGIDGRIIQLKATYRHTNVSDLWLSYGEEPAAKSSKILSKEFISSSYAELRVAQPTNMSLDDIKNNTSVEVDFTRYILGIISFSQEGNDVLFVYQGLIPDNIFYLSLDKEFFCENDFDF